MTDYCLTIQTIKIIEEISILNFLIFYNNQIKLSDVYIIYKIIKYIIHIINIIQIFIM